MRCWSRHERGGDRCAAGLSPRDAPLSHAKTRSCRTRSAARPSPAPWLVGALRLLGRVLRGAEALAHPIPFLGPDAAECVFDRHLRIKLRMAALRLKLRQHPIAYANDG